jgi:hypothetical protein
MRPASIVGAAAAPAVNGTDHFTVEGTEDTGPAADTNGGAGI